MAKFKLWAGRHINFNTLLNGLTLGVALFILNKADASYRTLIGLEVWRDNHTAAQHVLETRIDDFSQRLSGDEGKWSRTSAQVAQITNRLTAVEKKIGL